MRLISILHNGLPAEPLPELPAAAQAVARAYVSRYERTGFRPPWLGYFVLENGAVLASCGFKAPPRDGYVEMTYCTFPPHGERDLTSLIVGMLVSIAKQERHKPMLIAYSAMREAGEAAVLRQLGFTCLGMVTGAHDGTAWEWQRELRGS